MYSPITSYPTEGATNENVLFQSLGTFWTQVFNDRASIQGLTIAQAEETFQAYYSLIEAIDSYSAKNISVFKKIKWMPLMIKQSELNSNILRFGEGAVFLPAEDPKHYTFGVPIQQENNVYVITMPDNLAEVSIITNRVLAPTFVLTNNVDIQIKGNYLYFYGNPFNLPNVSIFNLIDEDGNQVYYNNPVTGQLIPDRVLTLWVYNAKINANALNYNIAYLFGINLPSTEQSKDILEATVKLYSGGPSIKQLKAICGAFLGVKPILETSEIIQDIFETTTHTIVVTDKHVYQYDLYYTVIPGLTIGSIVNAGDVLVDAVEFYDNIVMRSWWQTKMVPKVAATFTTQNSPAIVLPPELFVGNYKYGLKFENKLELISLDANGDIVFPIDGNPHDVAEFQQYINQNKDSLLTALTVEIGREIQPGEAWLINPLDFLFKTIFASNVAMIKICFKTQEQLNLFTKYYSIIKSCLPKHVYFFIYCDLTLLPTSAHTYVGNQHVLDDQNLIDTSKCPITATTPSAATIISMNSIASAGPNQNAICKELLVVKQIPEGITSRDYNFLDVTRLPA